MIIYAVFCLSLPACAPGVGTYDPKLEARIPGAAVLLSKDERFKDPKCMSHLLDLVTHWLHMAYVSDLLTVRLISEDDVFLVIYKYN